MKYFSPRTLSCRFAFGVINLCVLGSAAYAQTPTPSPKIARSNAQQIAEATKTFTGICAGCHGLDGRGSERGPNIASREEVRRRSDAEMLRILRDGIPAAGMPNFASLGNAKLAALVSYLRTLQGKSASLPIPGEPRRGGPLFFGTARCADCHMVSGKGGFIASDLSAYAADSSPDEIRQAILTPNRDSRNNPGQVQVTLADGKVWEGVVRNEDNFSLQLLSLDGVFHLIQKHDISAIKPSSLPLMPSDYGQKLSPAQLDDIVGYLMTVAKTAPEKVPKAKKRAFD